jgi:hypothetical protein
MIQGSEDGGIGSREITRKTHDGIAKINMCGNGNMKKDFVPMKKGPTLLFFYLMYDGACNNRRVIQGGLKIRVRWEWACDGKELGCSAVLEMRCTNDIHYNMICLSNTDPMGTLDDPEVEKTNDIAFLEGEDKKLFEALLDAEELREVITNTQTIICGNGDAHLRGILFPSKGGMIRDAAMQTNIYESTM